MARVLVVDDALMMRKTIGTFLFKAGHIVVDEAANGIQAVAAYKKHLPDLVTMDITMPEVDGINALSQIMAFDPGARVVMVSALGQKHKVFDALQAGAKGYILKPFTEEKLISILNELLGATANKINVFQPDVCRQEDKPLTAKMPFSVDVHESGCKITIWREFSQVDFDELTAVIAKITSENKSVITFDFTSGNALNNKSAGNFKQVVESFAANGALIKIICYTQDYAVYFRSSLALKDLEFELVKKRGAL